MTNCIKYLKIYAIISAIFSILYLILYLFLISGGKDNTEELKIFLISGSICLLPIATSLIILLIGKKTNTKHPKITKIFANIINIAVLLIHGFYVLLIFLFYWAFSDIDDYEYTDVKDYQKAIDSYYFEAVEHFPKEIPSEAQNVSLLRTPGGFLGDSSFYLKFDISENYIQKEKEKYVKERKPINLSYNDLLKKEYDYDKERAYSVLGTIVNDSGEGWKMNIIESSQCFRGIAVKNNTIIYILYCD